MKDLWLFLMAWCRISAVIFFVLIITKSILTLIVNGSTVDLLIFAVWFGLLAIVILLLRLIWRKDEKDGVDREEP